MSALLGIFVPGILVARHSHSSGGGDTASLLVIAVVILILVALVNYFSRSPCPRCGARQLGFLHERTDEGMDRRYKDNPYVCRACRWYGYSLTPIKEPPPPAPSSPPAPASAPDPVAIAAKEVLRTQKVWERYGCREVSDQELLQAAQRASQSGGRVGGGGFIRRMWGSLRLLTCRLTIGFLRLAGLTTDDRLLATLLLATFFVALTAFILLFFSLTFIQVIIACVFVFFLSAFSSLAILASVAESDLEDAEDRLVGEIAEQGEQRKMMLERRIAAKEHAWLLAARKAKQEYDLACQQYRELTVRPRLPPVPTAPLNCPHCGGQFVFDGSLAGRVVVCPHCGRHVTASPVAPPGGRG